MKEIDTRIRHVTKPGANLFAELGFPAAEAERYQAESRKQIEELVGLKEQLMEELADWIRQNGLKQEEAARILHVSRPRVSDVVNKKSGKFTLDALVAMMTLAGKPVRLLVG